MCRKIIGLAAALTSWHAGVFAFDTALDRRAIEEALSIGQSRIEAIRTRFHAAYRITVGTAPVDYLDVITPFRHVVLAAETRARAGDRSYGLRQAETEENLDALVLQVELTFHPLNTFIGVPGYRVLLASGPDTVPPMALEPIPRFGPRFDGVSLPTSLASPVLPGGGQPLTGGTLIARFSTGQLDARGAYELRVMDGKNVLGKARVDFARLR